jgi:hypothetical protein
MSTIVLRDRQELKSAEQIDKCMRLFGRAEVKQLVSAEHVHQVLDRIRWEFGTQAEAEGIGLRDIRASVFYQLEDIESGIFEER